MVPAGLKEGDTVVFCRGADIVVGQYLGRYHSELLIDVNGFLERVHYTVVEIPPRRRVG